MTPAVNAAKKLKITFTLHKYKHDPGHGPYGIEAAEKLGIDPSRVYKTLVVQLDNSELAVVIIPVENKLNLKNFARHCNAKKAEMAEGGIVTKSTGYVLGGVSPMGQKKRLQTYLDTSANDFSTIYVSAGKRGLEIELGPEDLLRATNGSYFDNIT